MFYFYINISKNTFQLFVIISAYNSNRFDSTFDTPIIYYFTAVNQSCVIVERFLRDYTAIDRLLRDVAGLLMIKDSAIITFIVSTMLSIGMSVNLKQIKAIISNYKLMAKGLLANFLILPVVA